MIFQRRCCYLARQQGNISAKKVSTAKKIDPAPSQLNNTAEMRDWYQKIKKILKIMLLLWKEQNLFVISLRQALKQ